MRKGLKGLVSVAVAVALTISGFAVGGGSTLVAEEVKAEENANATSGKCGDNLTWELDENGHLTISGKGPMYDYDRFKSFFAPWKGRIVSVRIENGVTNIGGEAFFWCSDLTSVIIPDSVTSIKYLAFAKCTSLKNIEIPDSVTEIEYGAFNETGLTSITLPDNLTVINLKTFGNCTSLTSFKIPNNVTEIGSYAFVYCLNLTSITIPNSVKTIYDYAFEQCFALKDVYYSGSEEEWNSIKIGVKNEYLTGATIHYNCEGPASVANGDVNGDGKVDLLDLRMILRHVCGKTKLSAEAIKAGDLAGNDGKIDLLDLRAVLRIICGKVKPV